MNLPEQATKVENLFRETLEWSNIWPKRLFQLLNTEETAIKKDLVSKKRKSIQNLEYIGK